MIISKKTSHYRFNKWYEKYSKTYYDIEYSYTLCDYFWTTFLRLILGVPFHFIDKILTTEVYFPEKIDPQIKENCCDRFEYYGTVFVIAIAFAVMAIIAFCPVLLLLEFLFTGSYSFFSYTGSIAVTIASIAGALVYNVENVQDFIVLAYKRFKAFKGNFCPIIKFEEED